MSSLQSWSEILRTQNLSPGKSMDTVSRWLLITRASVFPMTVTSGAIGGFLAAPAAHPNWIYFAVALLGLVLAHAANNMINDYFDLESGIDNDEYVRSKYAPHPVLSGLIYQTQGLTGCLWWSTGFVIMAGLLSMKLPLWSSAPIPCIRRPRMRFFTAL